MADPVRFERTNTGTKTQWLTTCRRANKLAEEEGLEPPTYWLTVPLQLSLPSQFVVWTVPLPVLGIPHPVSTPSSCEGWLGIAISITC